MCAITGRSNPCFTRQFSSDTPTTLELYLSGLHVALLEYLLCHWQGSTNQTLETIPALAILLA